MTEGLGFILEKRMDSGFLEREISVMRSFASCASDETRIDEAEQELADLRRSCAEGWRHAGELEEERKRLLGRLLDIAEVAILAHDET